MSNDEDYKAGFGKPPKHTQFQPGQSGNSKGQPKRTKTITALSREELKASIPVTENGTKKTMTKREVIVRQVVNGGLKGKPTFALRLLQRLETLIPTEVEPESNESDEIEVIVVPAYNGKPFHPTDEKIEFLAQRRRAKVHAKKAVDDNNADTPDFLK